MKQGKFLLLLLMMLTTSHLYAQLKIWSNMTEDEILEMFSSFKRSVTYVCTAEYNKVKYEGWFKGFSYDKIGFYGLNGDYKFSEGKFEYAFREGGDTIIYDSEGLRRARRIVYNHWKKQFKSIELDGCPVGILTGKVVIEEEVPLSQKTIKEIDYGYYEDEPVSIDFMVSYGEEDKNMLISGGKLIVNNIYEQDLIVDKEGLESISFPNKFENNFISLEGCTNLKKLVFSKNATTMPDISGCTKLEKINPSNIRNINLPSTLVSLSSFENCESVEDIIIPDGVTILYDFHFYGCKKLMSIMISENSQLEYIGYGAFSNCPIHKINLPSSLKGIGEWAFYNCKYLEEINSYMTEPCEIGEGVFLCDGDRDSERYAIYRTAKLNVPRKTYDIYVNTPCWNLFSHIFDAGYSGGGGTVTTRTYNYDITAQGKGDVVIDKKEENAGTDRGWTSSFDGLKLREEQRVVEIVHYPDSGVPFKFIPDAGYIVKQVQFCPEKNGTLKDVTNDIVFDKGISGYIYKAFDKDSSPKLVVVFEAEQSGTSQVGDKFMDDGIEYEIITTGTVAVTTGKYCTSANCTIPEKVTYNGVDYKVTSIGDNAFTNCTALTSLTIPASVTNIGEAALAGCTSLTAFTVAEGNNSFTVDDGILYNIDKTTLVCCPGGKAGSVKVPTTVTKIEPNGFYNCINLTGIHLQAGIKKVGDAAFVGCSSLTTMDFPSGSQSGDLLFGMGCFTGCTSLASFTVDGKKDGRIGGNSGNYGVFDGVLYLTKGAGEVYGLLAYPSKHGDVYTVSEGTSYISDYAFCMTDIKEVTLPSSLRGLNKYAFGYCNNLTKVTAKALIPCEAANAFASTAEHVTLYVLSDGLKGLYQTSDGWNGFSGYVGGSEQITIFADNTREQFFKVLDGSSVALVAIAARNGSKITIPAQVTSGGKSYTVTTLGIGMEKKSILGVDGVLRHFDYSLFDLCNSYMYDQVKEVVIPNTVTKIGNSAFNGNFGGAGSLSLTSVDIPGSVEEIGGWAFAYNKKLTTLTLNSGLKKIGEGAFVGAAIKSVTIPETVTRIESQAFNSCLSLESANIPPSVQFIGNYAFQTAEGFNTLKVNISDLDAWCKVESDGEYWEGPVWMCPLFLNGNEVTELVIPDGMTSISKVFLSCPSLIKVTIPSSIQDIGCAFSFCANLQTVINLSEEPQIIETYTTDGVEARTRSEGETHAAFDYTDKNTCVLYIPKGCMEKYRAAIGWKDFLNIVEMNSTAIDGILMDGKPFDVYDLQGRKVLSGATSPKSLPKGVYIVRGKKVVVK